VQENINLYIYSISPYMTTGCSFMRKYITCLCIVLLHTTVWGQNRIIDSLRKLAGSLSNDSLKSLVLIDLSSNYIGYDTIKCRQALQQAYLIIKDQKKWDYNQGYYYENKSLVIFWLGKFAQSLLLADSAIGFYQKSAQGQNALTKRNAGFRNAVVIADKGSTYSMMGDNESGIKSFLEGLRLYEQSDHPDKFVKIATCYNNIATLYYSQQQYGKSMEYDVRAIPFHLRNGDNESISFAYIYAPPIFRC